VTIKIITFFEIIILLFINLSGVDVGRKVGDISRQVEFVELPPKLNPFE